MSKIALSGDASGTGTFTIASPNSNSNFTLTLPTNSGTVITTASTGQIIPKAALPTGSVLQVVQTVKTDVFSTTSTTFVDITGLSVSITPTSATSKILVVVNVMSGSTGANEYYTKFNLVRDSTNLAVSTGAGAGQRNSTFATAVNTGSTGGAQYFLANGAFTFLDSPATTSSLTYKLQASGVTSYTSVLINRAGVSNGNDYNAFGSSTITVMEIAG